MNVPPRVLSNVHDIETGLSSPKGMQAWVRNGLAPNDPDIVVLTGGALSIDAVPDLIDMLEKLQKEYVSGRYQA